MILIRTQPIQMSGWNFFRSQEQKKKIPFSMSFLLSSRELTSELFKESSSQTNFEKAFESETWTGR